MPKRLNESLDDNGVVAALRESAASFSHQQYRSRGAPRNLFEIARPIHCPWCDTACGIAV